MILLRSFLLIYVLTIFAPSSAGASDTFFSCRAFRVHLSAPDPVITKAEGDDEETLIQAIDSLPSQNGFRSAWAQWSQSDDGPPPLPTRLALLRCLLSHVRQDTDGDGIPDWTALIDGHVSRVLYPLDEDMDGDQIPNVLDPLPLAAAAADPSSLTPQHLKLKNEDAQKLQETIYNRHHILALDHTAEQSPAVLNELLFLLDHGLPTGLLIRLTSIRWLYAFSSHDGRNDIAAFHREARALSIGGIGVYGRGPSLEGVSRIRVLAALAHEIGHAFVFDILRPKDLRQAAESFGGWASAFPNPSDTADFFAVPFFASHDLQRAAKRSSGDAATGKLFISEARWRDHNISSQYATQNIHEWFAEAFAAHILNRLGETGKLGTEWRSSLEIIPQRRSDYWFNYNNVGSSLREWIEARLQPRAKKSKSPSPRDRIKSVVPRAKHQ